MNQRVNQNTISKIRELAEQYNNSDYFKIDPIIFPKHFMQIAQTGSSEFDLPIAKPKAKGYTLSLKDIEIAAIISAHLAWGRRDMIIRDIKRAMDEMEWQPWYYISKGEYKDTPDSLHRTIKWSEFASICQNLRHFYGENDSIESLTPDQIRVQIYGQKSNPKMANKKIHMLRRWMVRDDGKVDLGIWKQIDKKDLIIPLDVHVHRSATELGITERKCADFTTAKEITEFLKFVFPDDPVKGDFALFAFAAHKSLSKK